MITQPTIPQLLETIRDELAEKIMPLIDDPTTKVNGEMIGALLNALVVRSENEIAWMLDESAAIESAATELIPTLSNSEAVSEALDIHQASPPESMRLSHVAESYQRASEVLSRLAEAAYAAGDDGAISRVQELIDARLAIENEAIGEFVAVGRS